MIFHDSNPSEVRHTHHVNMGFRWTPRQRKTNSVNNENKRRTLFWIMV